MDELKFDEYRFHFRPTGQSGDLFRNPEESWSNKNSLLDDILTREIVFNHRNRILKYLRNILDEKIYHFQIANQKVTKLEKDFHKTDIQNEPSCNVFIWNDPDQQKIYIESDKTSFKDSKVVAKILEKTINRALEVHLLKIAINPEIEESEFWNLVKRFEGKITGLEFNLLYPNLPLSHSTISDELKEVFQSIESMSGKLEFKAEEDKTLNLSEDNEQISSLNTASSLQGMPIVIKVEKERTKYKTGKTRKTKTVVEIKGDDIDAVKNAAKELFDLL